MPGLTPRTYNSLRSVTIAAAASKTYVFGPYKPGEILMRFLLNLATDDATLILTESIGVDIRLKRNFEQTHAASDPMIFDDAGGPGELALPLAPGSWVIPFNFVPDDQPQWVSVKIDNDAAGDVVGSLIAEGGPLDFLK